MISNFCYLHKQYQIESENEKLFVLFQKSKLS